MPLYEIKEVDLENYLIEKDEKGKTNLEKNYNLRFIANQYKIDKYEIDILAYSKEEKCFYIIELKRNAIDTKAYCQAMKYYNLLSSKYPMKTFKILLIGDRLEKDLYFNVFDYFYEQSMSYHNVYYSIYNFEINYKFNFYDVNQREKEKLMDNMITNYEFRKQYVRRNYGNIQTD